MQWESVLEQVDLVLETGFRNADVYLIQGLAYCNLGQYEEAIEAYTNGIELEPDYYAIYLYRAEAYREANQTLRAVQDIATIGFRNV